MTGERPLGIVCGRGLLPAEAAEIARARGRQVFLVGLAGSAGPEIEAFDHVWVKLGELGKMLKALQSRGVEDCAMLGAVARPEFSDIRLDWGAISSLGRALVQLGVP